MPFRDFTYPNVEAELGLTSRERSLFGDVAPLDLSPEFLQRLRIGSDLGVAVHTEKARSEFIVAPLLLELKMRLGDAVGVFSGVELDVDVSRGLDGVCDFVLTRSPHQMKLTSPVLAIVEAKREDLRGGLGQCIAATVAAREYNAMEKRPPSPVYGAVTSGTAWQFVRLDGDALTLDPHEYSVAEPGRILAILARIVG